MTDFAAIIGPVARELWGEPNKRLSTKMELRWGSRGARLVRLDKGTWADNETGDSGGVLDLLKRERSLDPAAAHRWLQDRGLEERAQRNGHDADGDTPDGLQASGRGRIVATYDYVDESGELLFQVVRFEPKDFRQRRHGRPSDDPDRIKDGWCWSVRGVRQVPYRLPELIEAIANGQPVWIVEGEKDVDNLYRLGVPATCNAGGAGKWRAELNEYFRGADVIIVQDNDPQARNPDPPKGDGQLRWHPDGRPVLPGQDHAQAVAKHMHGVAARVRVLDLTRVKPDLPLKGDVSDCIAAGVTAEALWQHADAIPDWRPAPFHSVFGGQWCNEIGTAGITQAYEYFIEDVLPLGETVLLFGESGSGKSFGALEMAMCGARGLKFNGFNVDPGLSVFIAAEAGKGFGKRKIAYYKHHGLQQSMWLPFYLMTKRPDFFGSDDDVTAAIEEIKGVRAMCDVPLRAVFLDTLSALTPGMNENSSSDVSIVRRRLERIREALNFQTSIVLVHHKPKGGSTPRGHGSLTADFETTIEFETPGITDSYGLPVHRATVRKQREGKSGISWQFTLPVVEVGRNKWGNKDTSCVVQPYATQTRIKGGFHANSQQLLFMRALFAALEEHGVPPPPKLPRSVSRAVEQAHVRAKMREMMPNPDGDEKKQDDRFRTAYSRAFNSLRDARVIGVEDPVVWYANKPVVGLGEVEAAPSPAEPSVPDDDMLF